MKTFLDSVKDRRSIYTLSNQSLLTEDELVALVESITANVPSSFNMQSQRVVLLLNEHKVKLWDIVLETLRNVVPAENFKQTQDKIASFQASYGTLLFFEEQQVVDAMGDKFELYRDNFKTWAIQANGMLQYALWVALEEKGFGASLQHYNPLIDDEVKAIFNLPKHWKLSAQMPFGVPSAQAGPKEFIPINEKVKVFK